MYRFLLPSLLAPCALAASMPRADLPEVRIDRRFELMSIVFRLAGLEEYCQGAIEDYNAAVDAHFSPFKEHRAVQLARKLRPDLGYDAIPSLAFRAQDAKHFRPLRGFRRPGTGLDQRWELEVAEDFLMAMSEFARDAKAEAFFTAQAPFYGSLVKACKEGLVGHLDLSWFTHTFGKHYHDRYIIDIAPLNGNSNYGLRVPNGSGGDDRYVIIGTPYVSSGQRPKFHTSDLPTLVHELLHSFVNPWVDRHIDQLRASGEALNAPVLEQMRRQAYGSATTAIKESMVRAFTIQYFRDHRDDREVEAQEIGNAVSGFYWIKPMADRLKELTNARQGRCNLEADTPQWVKAFEGWAARCKEMVEQDAKTRSLRLEKLCAGGPTVLSVKPANGAKDVDSTTSSLQITFDRPMCDGQAWCWGSGEMPQHLASGRWNEAGTVLTVPVRLKPGTTYGFMLNSEGILAFRSRDAERPLRPTGVTFTTLPQSPLPAETK